MLSVRLTNGGNVSETQQISVSYRPSLADVLHAARVAEGENWKTPNRVAAILLFIGSGVMLYLGFVVWAVIFLILTAVELFNLLPLSVVVAWIEFRRNPKYCNEYHLTLAPEHMRFQTGTVDSTLRWELYSQFWETKRAFILAYGPGIPAVIPKQAFADDREREVVRSLLKRVITQHGRR
jgi:hypothetical protein